MALDLFMVQRESGIFVPANPTYARDLERAELPLSTNGEQHLTRHRITQPRNVGHHRKLFGWLGSLFQNQQMFDNRERMRAWLVVKAGYYNSTEYPGAVLTPEFIEAMKEDAPHVFFAARQHSIIKMTPKSLSFKETDQAMFQEVYDRMEDVVMAEFGFNIGEWETQVTS